MESSHRRIINDLEDKHRQEIDRLLMEKETALAEETQVLAETFTVLSISLCFDYFCLRQLWLL